MPAETPSSPPAARREDLDANQIPRQSWLELVPRRSLWKALAMLLLLVAIVFIQRRAEVVVRHLGGLTPAPAAERPQLPEGGKAP